MSERANLINAMQIAGQRGWNLAERHEARSGHTDSIRLELETDCGATVVEGAVLLGNPRSNSGVDGIYCEAPLSGHLIFMKNLDVPGVIGHVGMVLGRNNINIANFSLGRGEVPAAAGGPMEAVAVVSTDDVGYLSEKVLQQLRENPAGKAGALGGVWVVQAGGTYNRGMFAPKIEERLDRLERRFPRYLQEFNTKPPFNDSQLEHHQRTIALLGKLRKRRRRTARDELVRRTR